MKRPDKGSCSTICTFNVLLLAAPTSTHGDFTSFISVLLLAFLKK